MPQPTTSLSLRERGAAAWEAAVSHAMVTEIGAGSLPYDTFRYYFEQNVRYLEDYARAIALVIARAPEPEAITVLTRFLNQIVETELPANHAFLKRLGGERPTADDALAPTTYAYTRHLLDTAARHDIAHGLAALLPCQWSYGEIAVRLATALPDDPIYAAWIAMFAGDGYADLVDATTGLLDRYSNVDNAAQLASLSAVFDRSTSYEVAFWDMAHTRGGSDGSAPTRSGLARSRPVG